MRASALRYVCDGDGGVDHLRRVTHQAGQIGNQDMNLNRWGSGHGLHVTSTLCCCSASRPGPVHFPVAALLLTRCLAIATAFFISLCCLAHFDEVILQEDKISALVKAANVDVEAFWPSLFAKLLQKVSVDDIVKGMSAAPAAGGGAPAGGAAPAAEAAAEEEVRLIWEWWMCMVEVDRGVHFVARMVLSGWCASLVNTCGAACGICAYSAMRNADPLPVSFVRPVLCLACVHWFIARYRRRRSRRRRKMRTWASGCSTKTFLFKKSVEPGPWANPHTREAAL